MDSFKSLPFPVFPSQRAVLNKYRADAVAKEAELVARKKQQLEVLRLCVLERIEAKNLNKSQNLKSSKKKFTDEVTAAPVTMRIPDSALTTRPQSHVTCKGQSPASRQLHVHPVHSNRVQSPANRLGALVKGHLTRKLFWSNKVQFIVRTIKDAIDVLQTLQEPLEHGDRELKHRMDTQLSLARMNLHEIFFLLPSVEQMYIIRQPSTLRHSPASKKVFINPKEADLKRRNGGGIQSTKTKSIVRGKLSAATLKSIQRRQGIAPRNI